MLIHAHKQSTLTTKRKAALMRHFICTEWAASGFVIAAYSILLASQRRHIPVWRLHWIFTQLSAHHKFASLHCCSKTEMHWESDCDRNRVDATWTPQPPPLQSKAAPHVLNLQRYGSTDRQTQSRTALDNRTTCKNLPGPGLPAVLRHVRVSSGSAHGIGGASAQKDGDRACLRPESSSLLFTHCMIQSPWQTLGELEYESSTSSHFCLEPAAYSTAFSLSQSNVQRI